MFVCYMSPAHATDSFFPFNAPPSATPNVCDGLQFLFRFCCATHAFQLMKNKYHKFYLWYFLYQNNETLIHTHNPNQWHTPKQSVSPQKMWKLELCLQISSFCRTSMLLNRIVSCIILCSVRMLDFQLIIPIFCLLPFRMVPFIIPISLKNER